MPSLKKRYRQLYFSPCSFDIGGYLLRSMHAAARVKAPGTRRSKPAAADPWQALPRLADLFDSQTPQPFFKGSKVSALEESALTETQLLEHTEKGSVRVLPFVVLNVPGNFDTIHVILLVVLSFYRFRFPFGFVNLSVLALP